MRADPASFLFIQTFFSNIFRHYFNLQGIRTCIFKVKCHHADHYITNMMIHLGINLSAVDAVNAAKF